MGEVVESGRGSGWRNSTASCRLRKGYGLHNHYSSSHDILSVRVFASSGLVLSM